MHINLDTAVDYKLRSSKINYTLSVSNVQPLLKPTID